MNELFIQDTLNRLKQAENRTTALEQGVHRPQLISCPSCLGQGKWDCECCNGSNGCSCGGQPVDMGTCNVCHGSGQVEDGNYDGNANLSAIQGMCYLGSGPK